MYISLHWKSSKLGLDMQLSPFCIFMNFPSCILMKYLYYSDLRKGGTLKKGKRDSKDYSQYPKRFLKPESKES